MRIWLMLLALWVPVAADEMPSQRMDWLLGCWENTDRSANEAWVRGTDGSLLGFAVTISDGRVGFYEILHILRDANGKLAYSAYPMGRSPTVFTETVLLPNHVVFTNETHDYPQEIVYRREGTTLFSTISGLNGANPRSFDKVRCTE